jgi:hypothetical protein
MQMKRISTTISQKHWELLNKYTEKYNTQQKVLEVALDNLENNSKQNPKLTPEEELWLRAKSTKSVCLVIKEDLRQLMDIADIDQKKDLLIRYSPITVGLEYIMQKPLKECSLKEIIDVLAIFFRISNWFDTIDQKDDNDYYTIMITHSLGFNASKLIKIQYEILFETCRVKFESIISERTIFMKIYKI